MKLLSKLGLLPFLAIAATSFAGDDTPPPFKDVPPLIKTERKPNTACSDVVSQGKTAWQRGYEQALSGTHFKYGFRNSVHILKPGLQACYEYGARQASEKEIECCNAGFDDGLHDLEIMLADYLTHSPKAAQTKDTMACYKSFGVGRQAAVTDCKKSEAAGCIRPEIPPNQEMLGCASIGYLAQLSQCTKVIANKKALLRALGKGAFATDDMIKKITDAEAPCPPIETKAGSANTTLPEVPPAGN